MTTYLQIFEHQYHWSHSVIITRRWPYFALNFPTSDLWHRHSLHVFYLEELLRFSTQDQSKLCTQLRILTFYFNLSNLLILFSSGFFNSGPEASSECRYRNTSAMSSATIQQLKRHRDYPWHPSRRTRHLFMTLTTHFQALNEQVWTSQ